MKLVAVFPALMAAESVLAAAVCFYNRSWAQGAYWLCASGINVAVIVGFK